MWKIVFKKKNSPEHAEESRLLVDPHVCADDTAMKEGCTAANLGGTAEAVFRPMGEKDSFLLFFGGISHNPVFFNESERGFRWI